MFKNVKVQEQKSELHIYNKELMNTLKVPELREIARSRGLKGWYRLRKSDLISFIITNDTEREVEEQRRQDEEQQRQREAEELESQRQQEQLERVTEQLRLKAERKLSLKPDAERSEKKPSEKQNDGLKLGRLN